MPAKATPTTWNPIHPLAQFLHFSSFFSEKAKHELLEKQFKGQQGCSRRNPNLMFIERGTVQYFILVGITYTPCCQQLKANSANSCRCHSCCCWLCPWAPSNWGHCTRLRWPQGTPFPLPPFAHPLTTSIPLFPFRLWILFALKSCLTVLRPTPPLQLCPKSKQFKKCIYLKIQTI